jgi:predicted amidohydrolase
VTSVAVGCCQLAPAIGDAAESRLRIEDAVTEAAAAGARIVVLPELAPSGYVFSGPDELREAAEPIEGPTARLLTRLAARDGLVIATGLPEAADDGTVYNSAILVDETGVRARYRKAHLWDTEKTVGFGVGEQAPPVVDTRHGRIGIMVCDDLEFPEWVRGPALDGAELLCGPVNWPLYPRPDGERPGEIVRVQADAAVNRMAIAVADRCGAERGQEWLGGSVIVDADGYPLTALHLGEAATIVAEVELADSRDKSVSERNDVLADRRPELYGRVAR